MSAGARAESRTRLASQLQRDALPTVTGEITLAGSSLATRLTELREGDTHLAMAGTLGAQGLATRFTQSWQRNTRVRLRGARAEQARFARVPKRRKARLQPNRGPPQRAPCKPRSRGRRRRRGPRGTGVSARRPVPSTTRLRHADSWQRALGHSAPDGRATGCKRRLRFRSSTRPASPRLRASTRRRAPRRDPPRRRIARTTTLCRARHRRGCRLGSFE